MLGERQTRVKPRIHLGFVYLELTKILHDLFGFVFCLRITINVCSSSSPTSPSLPLASRHCKNNQGPRRCCVFDAHNFNYIII